MIILDLETGDTTQLSADALNSHQEEIANIIEGENIQLNAEQNDQLFQALISLLARVSSEKFNELTVLSTQISNFSEKVGEILSSTTLPLSAIENLQSTIETRLNTTLDLERIFIASVNHTEISPTRNPESISLKGVWNPRPAGSKSSSFENPDFVTCYAKFFNSSTAPTRGNEPDAIKYSFTCPYALIPENDSAQSASETSGAHSDNTINHREAIVIPESDGGDVNAVRDYYLILRLARLTNNRVEYHLRAQRFGGFSRSAFEGTANRVFLGLSLSNYRRKMNLS